MILIKDEATRYVFSSTKLEKKQNRFCLEVRGWGREEEGRDGERDNPNNVCT
jgi:hypothetical protein